MTPTQKLVRLAELNRQIESLQSIQAAHAGDVAPLLAERAQILGDVHLPPHELGGLNDPEAWAKGLAETVAGLGAETALAWMLGAMSAAQEYGFARGVQAGSAAVVDTREREHAGNAALLRLVLDMIDRKQIRPPMVRDSTDADNPPRPLREHLVEALRSMGEDVE